MATIRVNINKQEEEPEKSWKEMTLMEKFRKKYSDRREVALKDAGRMARYAYISIAFQTATQPYMFLCFIIPRLFEEYDAWTQYWLKLMFMFLVVQTLMNYFCTLFYSTNIIKTRDNPTVQMKERWENPPEYFESYNENQPLTNGNAKHLMNCPQDESGLPWKYCDDCDFYIPPRAHHCYVCRTCILKHDHHCYFVGTCIGFKNQRYFFVLNLYASLLGCISFYSTIKYLQYFYWPTAYSWTNFFPPLAIFRWCYGAEDLNINTILLLLQLYNELLYGVFGIIYFTSQLTLVIKGVTMFEFSKRVRVKCNNSINQNFRSVFGDFWALNFLFPMTILFKQRDDGFKWEGIKVDYNSNYEHKLPK